jgi:type I restriction-modification system DNA methylase subunit
MLENDNAPSLGLARKPLEMADKLCGCMEAAEYKDIALGRIFLKLISDAFKAKNNDLGARTGMDHTHPTLDKKRLVGRGSNKTFTGSQLGHPRQRLGSRILPRGRVPPSRQGLRQKS